MKEKFDSYERLAGAGKMFGMSSLWQGEDHLVYVKGSGFLLPFSEEYRRYRYRDIQSLTLTKTSRILFALLHFFGILISGGAIVAFVALGGTEGMGPGSIIFFSLLIAGAILSLLLFLRHLILGPTCRCYLQTNVKRELIRPLNRLHQSTQAIERISPLIQESQAEFGAIGSATRSSAEAEKPEHLREQSIRVPWLALPTFAILAVFGLLIITALHIESVFVNGISLAVLTIGTLAVVGALIACVRYATPESIRNHFWILLGQVFLFAGAASVYFVMTATENPEYAIGMSGPLEAFSVVSTMGGVGFYAGLLAVASSIFLVSLSGMVQAMKWKKRLRAVAGPIVSNEPPEEVAVAKEEADG